MYSNVQQHRFIRSSTCNKTFHYTIHILNSLDYQLTYSPFIANGHSNTYQLNESIFNVRFVVRIVVFFGFSFLYSNFNFTVFKQSMTTLIGLSAVAKLVLEFGLLFEKDLITGLLRQ